MEERDSLLLRCEHLLLRTRSISETSIRTRALRSYILVHTFSTPLIYKLESMYCTVHVMHSAVHKNSHAIDSIMCLLSYYGIWMYSTLDLKTLSNEFQGTRPAIEANIELNITDGHPSLPTRTDVRVHCTAAHISNTDVHRHRTFCSFASASAAALRLIRDQSPFDLLTRCVPLGELRIHPLRVDSIKNIMHYLI